jgi:AAA domain-containing protein
MLMADEPVPYVIDRVAARECVTVIAGAGGEGKSLLAQALTGGVLRGATIAGIRCEKGRVAIFDAENGPRVIAKRTQALGLPLDGLSVYDAAGLDLERDEDVIAEAIEGVDLVVFDSLRTLAPGAKENDSDDMAPVMAVFRRLAIRTRAAVLVIHHRGKDAESDFRGSSAIRDQLDLMFVLGRAKGDPEARWRREMRCSKCRIADEPAPRWIGIKHHRGEIALTEAAPFTSEKRTKAHEVADELEAVLKAHGPMRPASLAAHVERKRNDGTFARALDLLSTEGRAFLTGDGWSVASVAKRRHGDSGDGVSPASPSVATHVVMATSGDDDTHDHEPEAA